MGKRTWATIALVVMAGLLSACRPDASDVMGPDGQIAPQQAIESVVRVQARHADQVMAIDGVVGTGVGLDADGRPVIRVFTLEPGVRGIPDRLDGVPVNLEVTGMFVARSDPTTRFDRPTPIGVSTGHPEITAGTIGARVTDGVDVYILSNNHVLANQNDALLGDPALQPGAYDGGTVPDDVIGWLHDYKPIDFDGGENTIDAAIALSNVGELGYSTPADDGYGTPSSMTTEATVGQSVRKYGRTTGLTEGEVSEVSVAVDVCYEAAGPRHCKKSARFVDQIAITPGSFSGGGDSGSLIVDQTNHPVGLLFAGSSSRTLANRIDPVLEHFFVTIDDGSGDTGNSPPVASFIYTCEDLTCDFNASGSSDGDGDIVEYAWDFGDGSFGSGVTPTTTHTYTAGTYVAKLTVTDNGGATDSQAQTVSVGSLLHVGNLDRASTKGGGSWTAYVRVTVHAGDEVARQGALVSGTWDTESGRVEQADCTTDASGVCEITPLEGISNRDGNVVFRVDDVLLGGFGYDASASHDPDGNSNGTVIRVFHTNSDDYKKN